MSRLNIRCPQCAGKGKVIGDFLLDALGNPTIPVLVECDLCQATGINFVPFLMGRDGKFDLLDASTSNLLTLQTMVAERQLEGFSKFHFVVNTADWHTISTTNTPEEDRLHHIPDSDQKERLYEVKLKTISDMPRGRGVLLSVASFPGESEEMNGAV